MPNSNDAFLPVVLTMAGSDPSGGAGIQADLKTFQAMKCYGTSVITAITAQNSRGVFSIHELDAAIVASQLLAVLDDLPVRAAKTGMLYSAPVIHAVKEIWKKKAGSIPLVIDPVMVSSSGTDLLLPDAREALKDLLRIATLITPNLPEAEYLIGRPVQSESDMKEAALELHERYGAAILIKGGHRLGLENRVLDVLYDGTRFLTFTSERLPDRNTHGTGCTLSAGIVAGLALGRDLQAAVANARDFLLGAIQHAPGLGEGLGPLNHLWKDG